MADVPIQHDPRPGQGLLGWLGRQVGHVTKALKTNVTGPKIVYRENTVQEMPHPADPNVKMRRTVIDEVIIEKPQPPRQGE
jgi:hypothetical protein